MLTKEEIKIIDLFRKDLFRSYTIREIMKNTSKKSYPWTFNSVRKMEKMGLIDMAKNKKIGLGAEGTKVRTQLTLPNAQNQPSQTAHNHAPNPNSENGKGLANRDLNNRDNQNINNNQLSCGIKVGSEVTKADWR